MLEPSMRLKVTGDTFFLPDPEGVVYFRNNKVSFRMEGPQIDRWIEMLIPMFTGEHTMQELTDGLPKAHRERVYEIAAALLQHGFVRDVSLDRSHRLPKPVLDKFAAQIDFLDAFGGSGASRFETYRNAKVLAAGKGPILVSLVSALLESGLPAVQVMNEEATEEEIRRIGELAANAGLSDPTVRVKWVPNPGSALAWRRFIEPFDAVLYASMEGDMVEFRALHEACRKAGKLLIPALQIGQTGVAGPMVGGNRAGCWESAWRRLHRAAVERNPHDHASSPTAEGMLANVLVFELFKSLAGVPGDGWENEIYVLNLETLEGARHAVLAHPDAEGGSDWRPQTVDPEKLKGQDEVGFEQLLVGISRLTSPVTGIFAIWDEGDWKQLPVSLCRVQAADPLSPGPAERLPVLLCGGFTHEEARREAAAAGLEDYARRWLERRIPMAGIGIGAGGTAAEAVCRGLHQRLQQLMGEKVRTQPPTGVTACEEEIADERCLYYLTSLIHLAEKPELYMGQAVQGFPSRWVRCAGVWYGAAGLTGTAALREALLLAVMASQTSGEQETAEPQRLHPAVDGRELAAAYDDAMRTLRGQGLRLAVYDLSFEAFMKESFAGVYGVEIRKEGTP